MGNASEFENEWRTNKILGRFKNGWSECFSNFSWPLENGSELKTSAAQSRAAQFRLTFKWLTYIPVCMLDMSRKETDLIIWRVTVRVIIIQSPPTRFNTCEWNTMNFHITERVLLLS
jgi:hypothetical protein